MVNNNEDSINMEKKADYKIALIIVISVVIVYILSWVIKH
jgi:hypothetical protein